MVRREDWTADQRRMAAWPRPIRLVGYHFGISREVQVAEVTRDLMAHPEVCDVYRVHIWATRLGCLAFAACVVVTPSSDSCEVRTQLERRLARLHRIRHTVLQLDYENDRVTRVWPRLGLPRSPKKRPPTRAA
jgi:hypothetical protein